MQLDDEIRDALAREASAIPQASVARLRGFAYKPRRHALSPRVMGGGAAAATAAAGAGVLLAIGGTGTQTAFAGWSATPTAARAGQASDAQALCAARIEEASRGAGSGKKSSTDAVVTDTRGRYTLLAYPQVWCFTGPGFTSLTGRRLSEGVSISTGYRNGQAFTIAGGPAAADASAVTLSLQDGSTLEASVAGASFIAWWPSTSRPTSVTYTTASGTRTEPLSFPPAPSLPAGKHSHL